MTRNTLAERGKSLEDAFFARQDAELTRRLVQGDHATPEAAALAKASGLSDPAVMARLTRLGVTAANLAALTLVPLVAVAWADGDLDEPERGLLRFDAARLGLDAAHPGHGLFKAWLTQKPDPELFDAWKAYVAALPADARAELAPAILERTQAVAEAAGGFLGLGRRVSAAEQAVVDEVGRALSS